MPQAEKTEWVIVTFENDQSCIITCWQGYKSKEELDHESEQHEPITTTLTKAKERLKHARGQYPKGNFKLARVTIFPEYLEDSI